MQESSIDIVVESAKGQNPGTAKLKTVAREQAMMKALVAFGACWGIALLTLPIPIVHFIAPPLLLLAGPLVGFLIFKMYNGATDILSGESRCPDCGNALLLKPGAASWPLSLACAQCEGRLLIRPSAALSR